MHFVYITYLFELVHMQYHTNALLLAIAKEGQEKVVDAFLDHEPELDLQDSVCFIGAVWNTAVSSLSLPVW